MLSQDIYTSSSLARYSQSPGSHPHAFLSQKNTLCFINDSHFKSDLKQACRYNWTMHSHSTVRLPPNKTTPFCFPAQMWFVDFSLEALGTVETVWVEPCRAGSDRAGPGWAGIGWASSLSGAVQASVCQCWVFPARTPKESRAVRQRCGCRCYNQLFIASPLIVSTSPGLNLITKDCTLSNLTLPARDWRCCEVRVKHFSGYFPFSLCFLICFCFFYWRVVKSAPGHVATHQ